MTIREYPAFGLGIWADRPGRVVTSDPGSTRRTRANLVIRHRGGLGSYLDD